jgi:uncharacterized repeat protein (TIGR03803 family)
LIANRKISGIDGASAGVTRNTRKTRNTAALSLLAILLIGAPAAAQSFQVVVDFGIPGGRQPKGGPVQGQDGCFYGTAVGGGKGFGTIFRVCSGVNTTIFSFDGVTTGSYPQSGLMVASDGDLYGTTRMGAAHNAGTVFKIDPVSKQLTTLHVFSGSNGAESLSELAEGPDGRLYGMTSMGGSANRGVAFAIQKSGSGFTLLRSFTGANGRGPSGRLVAATDGFLYGTTAMGGAVDKGTIFRLSTTGTLTTLVSFTGTNGANPYAGLVQDTDGYLYGTTGGGGTGSQGTVFRVSLTGALTVLRSFSGVDGSFPNGELAAGADGLYGTTMFGGTGSGVVFKMTRAGVLTVLRLLSPTDGARPESALFRASNGRFYGTAPNNGPAGAAGTLFEVTSSGTFTRLLAFSGAPSTPHAALVAHPDGSLYGVSAAGGSTSSGTIFRLVPGVSIQVLHEFYGPQHGAGPYDALTVAGDGSIYGTAPGGGTGTAGTIYKLSSAGAFSVLNTPSGASGDGVFPYASVVKANDGAYYGVMAGGGAAQAGTIYRMSSAGVVTREYSFNGTASGKMPYGRLEVGTNGLLYGTTTGGGASFRGTLYSYDPSARRFTLLVTFSGANGANPFAGVTQGSDARLYGTTFTGGLYGYGSIFAFDIGTHHLTTLHSFNSSNGTYPYAALAEASDGRLYGTTSAGGAYGLGTVFSIAKSGGHALLHSFRGSDGSSPRGGLVQAQDSYLYGATSGGGSTNSGVIYRVAPSGTTEPPPNVPPAVALTGPSEGASFTAPASMTLQATASDTDGTVAEVAFYANGTLLGKDTTSPYSFAWTGVPVGSYTLTAVAKDNAGATQTSAPVAVTVSTGTRLNVALAANGATATASSSFGPGFGPAAVINGDRRGLNFGAGGAWKDGTPQTFPDWVEVTLAGAKSISEIDVFMVQDNPTNPVAPTLTMTFSTYGLRDFTVQYWTGTAWQAVPGGVVTGNTLVWRKLAFTPITTTKIRVLVPFALTSYSRIAEVEAY